MGGLHLVKAKSLQLMPANVYVDPAKNGVRVGDVVEIVTSLYWNEFTRNAPQEIASVFVSFQPIGALARVGGALADVPLTAMAEYRKSQSLEYAASHVVTSTGKLIKTAVVEAADLAKYMAQGMQVGLEWMDGQYEDTSGAGRVHLDVIGGTPPVHRHSTGNAGGRMPGGQDLTGQQAPFVAGLWEAGAAVQQGLSEA